MVAKMETAAARRVREGNPLEREEPKDGAWAPLPARLWARQWLLASWRAAWTWPAPLHSRGQPSWTTACLAKAGQWTRRSRQLQTLLALIGRLAMAMQKAPSSSTIDQQG